MPLPQLNYKKILLLIGFVVVTLALAYAVVWVFFLQGREEPVGPSAIQPDGQLPGTGGSSPPGSGTTFPIGSTGGTTAPVETVDQSAQGGLTNVLPVNEGRTLDPTPTRNGQDIAFYDPTLGQFFRVSADGQNKTLMTDQTFYAVQSVTWADDKSKAVLEFPDGANIIYDFTKRSSKTLPRETVDHQFAPNSEAIAFKIETDNSDDNWLVVTDTMGENPRFIEPVGDRGHLVQVAFSPNEEVVAIYHKPVGPSSEEIFLLGQAGENYRSFVVDGLNFKGQFAPDGQRLLYHVVSAANGYNPSLWVADAKGDSIGLNKFNLNLATWVDKCAISGNSRTVYCAVPQTLASGSGLTPGSEKTSSDVFYSLNLDTGLKRLLAEPADAQGPVEVAVTDLWLDEDEGNLFFWDAKSGGVFKMRLE